MKHRKRCFSPLGFFFMSRFSFSVRSRSSFSRVSVPFRRVVGLALSRGCCSWLLLPSSRSFFGSVVWCGFASRSREKCLCLRLVRLCSCRALVVFVGGSSPFLGQHSLASYADAGSDRFFLAIALTL